jgi:putative nucleotidyltransferase with HDIG domain
MGQTITVTSPRRAPAADQAVTWSHRWRRRPKAAWALATALQLTPIALAVAVVISLGNEIDLGDGWVGTVSRFAVLSGVGLVVAEAAARVLRAFSPLPVLLRYSLAFPETTPARFRIALRAGHPRALVEGRSSAKSTPHEAAVALLHLVARLSDHDRATRGHSERVRAYTELIAEELDLPQDDRHRLRWTGLLHDIGKMRTPASILNKPTSLDAEEWEVIRRHPLDGLHLAAPLWPWLGTDILGVSDHHERWDGGGYPAGLAGDDISRAGRIVAVADAFDVMTSPRSYKPAIPVEAARQELVDEAGRQFDPEVVRAFLAISVRRLRVVVGPLSGLVGVLASRRLPFATPMARHAAAATATAALVLGGVVTPAERVPVEQAPIVVPGAGTPGTTGSARPGTGADGTTVLDRTIDREGGADREDGRRSDETERADPPEALEPPPGPGPPVPGLEDTPGSMPLTGGPGTDTAPDPDEVPAPDPPPGGPPSDSGPLAITIDPDAGNVTVENLGPGDAELSVDVPPVGSLACDGLDLCEPIVVTVPLL